MTDSVISGVHVRSMCLQVPLDDFGVLPLQLGCSLHRRRGSLVLSGARGSCALTFDIDQELATLTHLAVHDDLEGRFMRDVVLCLFIAYGGDLDATLEWTPARAQPPLVIQHGQTQHPLLTQPELPGVLDASFAMVEQWQHDARSAWDEYQRLKQSHDASA